MVKKIIILLIIISLFIGYQFMFSNFSNKLVLSLEKKNELLKKQFDSLRIDNKNLSEKLDSIQGNIDTIKIKESQLVVKYQNNKEIIKIIQSKYQKNNYIDTFSSSSILRYFKDSL